MNPACTFHNSYYFQDGGYDLTWLRTSVKMSEINNKQVAYFSNTKLVHTQEESHSGDVHTDVHSFY